MSPPFHHVFKSFRLAAEKRKKEDNLVPLYILLAGNFIFILQVPLCLSSYIFNGRWKKGRERDGGEHVLLNKKKKKESMFFCAFIYKRTVFLVLRERLF